MKAQDIFQAWLSKQSDCGRIWLAGFVWGVHQISPRTLGIFGGNGTPESGSHGAVQNGRVTIGINIRSDCIEKLIAKCRAGVIAPTKTEMRRERLERLAKLRKLTLIANFLPEHGDMGGCETCLLCKEAR
ncbi:MAG TPA: hypothetical protein PK691_11065, partial [Thermomicrobiales bacterium]|nr:hypothetical protein [Thermomicrobiales bacterium]